MDNLTQSNETIIEKPTLRTELPEDVIAYLEEKYPPRINGAGVKQHDNVDYITEERTFMQNEAVKRASLEALGLLWFLRLKMADTLGWGIDVTDKEYKKLCYELAIDLDTAPNKIHQLANELIGNGIIKVVNGSNNRTYWITLQQFYNYEYKNWTRIKNNIAARNYYLKKQGVENQEKPIQEGKQIVTSQTADETQFF